eukprot:GHRR01009778.1.p1 GENE.GHRR01009778.1~~GHRR01009778.1.p1  ORF type:complete len:129 (+),score=16.04 GHRR01009778.1:2206-2592(+)
MSQQAQLAGGNRLPALPLITYLAKGVRTDCRTMMARLTCSACIWSMMPCKPDDKARSTAARAWLLPQCLPDLSCSHYESLGLTAVAKPSSSCPSRLCFHISCTYQTDTGLNPAKAIDLQHAKCRLRSP